MGSYASLKVGSLTIEVQNGNMLSRHGVLFQQDDVFVTEPTEEDKEEGLKYFREETYAAAPLSRVANRLRLLGLSLEAAAEDYDIRYDFDHRPCPLSFDEVSEALSSLDVKTCTPKTPTRHFWKTYDFRTREFGEEDRSKPILVEDLVDRLSGWSSLFLFSLNPDNSNTEIMWQIDEVLMNGYITLEDVTCPLEPQQRFIVLTEGTTDSAIIQKSLEWLRPDVSDFFEFVETKDTSLTSSGELLRFARILSKVRVHSQIVIILDHDATGREMFDAAAALDLPGNIGVMHLPESKRFAAFETVGPSGTAVEDINGRAVAIECFLDLTFNNAPPPVVRWGAYNNKMKRYQGALERKDDYTKAFLNLKDRAGYDVTGLGMLVEAIVRACEQVACRLGRVS